MNLRTPFILFSLLTFSTITLCQKTTRINIKHADSLVKMDQGERTVYKLLGHVKLLHQDALMFCDSAYVYKENNSLEAYNNVKINQGDTLLLEGDTLYYDGNTKLARLRGDIHMEDPDLTLDTRYLDYNMQDKVGYYQGGGKIISKKEGNTLTSGLGHYYPELKTFYFKNDVVLKHPDYTIKSDTLKYNTNSEVTYFFGPTTITSDKDSNLIYCENGFYDTRSNVSQFNQNAYIETKDYMLQGDSLAYDREKGIGQVFGNIVLLDTNQDFMILGDTATHWERDSLSIVNGHAEMVQVLDGDSLFLHGDTLISTYDSTGTNCLLLAYNHVKFYKSDLQGQCDSLAYSLKDSLFQMFRDPVIWSDANQITSDSLRLVQANGKLQSMFMDRNAFIISKDDTGQYNQIKGKNMIGFFEDNKLRKVNVIGNGQTIYYAREEDSTLLGVNRAVCSNIRILIDSNQIDEIYFLTKPDATLTPLEKANPKDLFLKDFDWKEDERPLKRSDIFIWKKELPAPTYEDIEVSEEPAPVDDLRIEEEKPEVGEDP